jgi:hypothetical protein
MPVSTTSDAVQWVGAMFNSHGAQLVVPRARSVHNDASDMFEWFKKTVPFFMAASSPGRRLEQQGADFRASALIFNAPSACGHKRDAPKVAEFRPSDPDRAEGPARFRRYRY